MLRNLTTWFVLLAPLAIFAADFVVYYLEGYEATITGVVRDWADRSVWPEVLYAAGALALYAHLFRGWV